MMANKSTLELISLTVSSLEEQYHNNSKSNNNNNNNNNIDKTVGTCGRVQSVGRNVIKNSGDIASFCRSIGLRRQYSLISTRMRRQPATAIGFHNLTVLDGVIQNNNGDKLPCTKLAFECTNNKILMIHCNPHAS